MTKPGIIRGNLIAAAAGFLLAARGSVDWQLFAAMLAGLALIIAAGCVSNNYLDRHIDRKMVRTRRRALAAGTISGRSALIYAGVLGSAGTILLAVYTTPLALGLALFGYVAYVFVYGYAKRRSVHGTAVGSISGAIPPVVGYCAVTGQLDLASLLLFLVLVCWQMPHFYAIAMIRLRDYEAAGIPVLPSRLGLAATRLQMIAYIGAFVLACAALALSGYSGMLYLAATMLAGLYWLVLAIRGYRPGQEARWARLMFQASLAVLLVWCTAVSVDAALLPVDLPMVTALTGRHISIQVYADRPTNYNCS